MRFSSVTRGPSDTNNNPSTYLKKGVTYSSNHEFIECVFCRITRRDPSEPSRIVLDGEKFMSFRPLAPATNYHILICPKEHIKNLDALKSSTDINLLNDMIEFGKQSLISMNVDPNDASYCYHVPPFNSIDHLHLHVIGKPSQMNHTNWLKYFVGSYWCKSAYTLIDELTKSSS